MNPTTDIITPDSALTIPGLFAARVARTPDSCAYKFFDPTKNKWCNITWQETARQVSRWYKALKKEQLQPGDRIALMLPNGPEWICFDQAALALGLIVVPLFANDRPESIAYILEDTDARLLLCPGLTFWNDLAPVLDRLANIQRIITLDFCKTGQPDTRITCCTDWLSERGEKLADIPNNNDDIASIVYTSGTTGRPKGVMLTHRNILENSYAGLQAIPVYPNDLFLSFLPLSHMLERTVGYYLPIMAGATVAFARSIPLLAEDLLTTRPTALIAVPRIFEKIHAGIWKKLETQPTLVQGLFNLTVETGWDSFEYSQKRRSWFPGLLLKPFLDRLVARKIRQKLGGRIRLIISGGAPLSPEISHEFIGLGLQICQGYGLTETSPVISVNRLENNFPAGVGLPLPGVEVKVGKKDELMVRGSCVMQGYWKNPQATADTVDSHGWLHTGDQANLIDGHIHITGRLKEIIVLSNSEKVAPADLEMVIGTDSLFDQVMVVGENRPYLTLLAVLNPDSWQSLAAELNLPPDNISLHSETVEQAILQRVEQQLISFPGFAWIKRVTPTLAPWTIEAGLMTPTLKLRRRDIIASMDKDIRMMYDKTSKKI